MKDEADKILCRMPKLLSELLKCDLRNTWCPSRRQWQLEGIPQKGVYVFYESGKPLYVGRADGLKKRIKDHSASNNRKAALAFILTRDEWGLWNNPIWERDLYKSDKKKEPVEIRNSKGQQTKVKLSKEAMRHDKHIKQDFELQRERIRKMRVRVLEITEDYEQAIFEIYAARALDTPYNDFKNH